MLSQKEIKLNDNTKIIRTDNFNEDKVYRILKNEIVIGNLILEKKETSNFIKVNLNKKFTDIEKEIISLLFQKFLENSLPLEIYIDNIEAIDFFKKTT